MSEQMREIQTLTIHDIMETPDKFGMPTFEEFLANPEKWRKREEGEFEAMDKGSVTGMNKHIRSTKVEFELPNGHVVTLSSMEKAQSVAKEEGIALLELEAQPRFDNWDSMGCDLVIRFRRKPMSTKQKLNAMGLHGL
jgi:hypothetical protein